MDWDDDEVDDYMLKLAIEESVKEYEIHGKTTNDLAVAGPSGYRMSSVTDPQVVEGFDHDAGKMWIFPTNYTERSYQFNIVKKCLLNNTLVCLPTGLGKTFIAAVVMYNFYRWFPQGKIVFMAPTKPLVTQQIEACFQVMGISQNEMVELTGSMNPKDRKSAWESHRVFFLTPQVLSNDLIRENCFAEQFRCLVVDEAHRALGNHAYVVVVKELLKYNKEFRVLALSATPGSDDKAVQQVLTNLLISAVEIRSDESIDIQPYVNKRMVEKVVVPLSAELLAIKQAFMEVLTLNVNRLSVRGVLWNSNPEKLSQFSLLKERDRFRQHPPDKLPRSDYSLVESQFALCASLCHCLDLLIIHGLRSFYNFIQGILDGQKSNPYARRELEKNQKFMAVIEELRKKFDPTTAEERNVISHPKIQKLLDILSAHFNRFKVLLPEAVDDLSTRVMIFAQYRDTVNEITSVLNEHQPLVKAMSFVGRATATGNKGLTHKLQQQIVSQFRNGHYNTLVSTCVGEEGLDIGEVDLIICYDAHKSPVRLVQRMGRTGRKRDGRIVMLITQGKEENTYNQGQYNKRKINNSVTNCNKIYQMYVANPRMVPQNLDPVCDKRLVNAGQFETKTTKRERNESLGDKMVKRWKKSDSGFLNDEELAEWNKKFKMDEKDVYKFEIKTGILSLGSIDDETRFLKKKDNVLSVKNALPWQTTLQPAFLVSHTNLTKLLVKMMSDFALNGSDVSFTDKLKFQSKEETLGTTLVASKSKTRVLPPKSAHLVPETSEDDEVIVQEETTELKFENETPNLNLDRVDFGFRRVHFESALKPKKLICEPPKPISEPNMTDIKSKQAHIKSKSSKTKALISGTKLMTDFFKISQKVCEDQNEIEILNEYVLSQREDRLTDFFRFPKPLSDAIRQHILLSDSEASALRGWIKCLSDDAAQTEIDDEMLTDFDEALLLQRDLNLKSENKVELAPVEGETMCGLTQMMDLVAQVTPAVNNITNQSKKFDEYSLPNFDLFLEESDFDVVNDSPQKQFKLSLKNMPLSPIISSKNADISVPIAHPSHSTPQNRSKSQLALVNDLGSPETPKIKRNRKSGGSGRLFLQTQAEVDEDSEDDEDAINFYENDSFIDDDSDVFFSETQLGVYMQSVKDIKPENPPLPSKVTENVFSQEPESDDSSYEHDSFCVPYDFVDKTEPKTKVWKRIKMDETDSLEPNSTYAEKKQVRILVSSKEVSKATAIISRLRMDHKASVHVRSLPNCDYILSNRVGIARKTVTEVANVASFKIFLQSMKELIAIYPKPYLLIEEDRVKCNVTAKPMLHTIYYDSILVQLTGSPVRLMFSQSPNDSADMLFSLGELELKKGFGFQCPFEPSQEKLKMFGFYSTLPQISLCTVLNFCHRFQSVKQFINSCNEELTKNGEISKEKAEEIEKYLNKRFS
ncbi:hypothetical protein CHUAL_000039 [Chamberlinius hualienensis]